jgi:hypothetical protein
VQPRRHAAPAVRLGHPGPPRSRHATYHPA